MCIENLSKNVLFSLDPDPHCPQIMLDPELRMYADSKHWFKKTNNNIRHLMILPWMCLTSSTSSSWTSRTALVMAATASVTAILS